MIAACLVIGWGYTVSEHLQVTKHDILVLMNGGAYQDTSKLAPLLRPVFDMMTQVSRDRHRLSDIWLRSQGSG